MIDTPGDSSTWQCPWGLPATDGLYTLTLNGLDAAGNAITPAPTRTILVDRSAPTFGAVSWVEQTNPTAQHAIAIAPRHERPA